MLVDELISNHHRPLHPLHERYQSARLPLSETPLQKQQYQSPPFLMSPDQLLWSKVTISIVNKIPLTNTHRLKDQKQNPLVAHAVNAKADRSILSCACFTDLLF